MEGMNSSEIRVVVGSDAPSEYHEAPRTENSNHVAAGTTPAETSQTPAMVVMPVKKKRGRPRKYGPDGAVTKALSPKPIPTAAPPSSVIDFSSQKPSGKVRPAGSAIKHYSKMGTQSLGDWISCSVGSNFTPHIITVNAGEDVTMRVISFSQQGPRGICILSANGIISSVTLRQLDSSGGTMTYEGRFEILSLTGSFMPSENGGIKNRSGGVNVSLASADGRVVGGVAGLLVAASPVQVVVGSFLTGNQHEQKLKKPKTDSMISTAPAAVTPITSAVGEDSYGQQNTSETVDKNNEASLSFERNNWSAANPSESMTKTTDVNKNLPG